MTPLVDSHCHLDFPDFVEEREDVIARAAEAGVGWMLTIGTRLERFPTVLAIARAYPNVFCSVGIHPHEAAKASLDGPDPLVEAARCDPKVIAIGESGLDYFYDHSPRADQERIFRLHIAAARETGLPLVVHTRDAEADTLRILRDEMGKGAFPGLIHCFSGGTELAEGALEIGFYISFSGVLTFPRAEDLRRLARTLPRDRLLVETDSPYLAPVPRRGKRNEPAFVVHTARVLAEALDLSADDLAEATTDNFFRLFGKAARA